MNPRVNKNRIIFFYTYYPYFPLSFVLIVIFLYLLESFNINWFNSFWNDRSLDFVDPHFPFIFVLIVIVPYFLESFNINWIISSWNDRSLDFVEAYIWTKHLQNIIVFLLKSVYDVWLLQSNCTYFRSSEKQSSSERIITSPYTFLWRITSRRMFRRNIWWCQETSVHIWNNKKLRSFAHDSSYDNRFRLSIRLSNRERSS